VLAPLVGIIGSIQATETIKVLLDIGETLTGRLLVLDALNMEWRSIKLRKDPDCPVCGTSVVR
jgi:molybdopterin-synthase adenylyltransferase